MDNLDSQNPTEGLVETHSRSFAESLKRSIARDNGDEPPEEASPPEVADETPLGSTTDQAEAQEQPEPEAQAEPETAEVELDGKTYKVPAELKDGYLRQSDYTKKTQEVAKERQAVEAVKAQVAQAFQVAQNLGPALAEFAQAQKLADEYSRIDYQALYQSDPLLHNKLKIEQQENWQKLQSLNGYLQQAPRALQAAEEEAFRAEVARNAPKALELVPDLPKRGADMIGIGREYGFTDQELSNVADPRYVKVLRDLLELRELTKNRYQIRAKVEGAPPVAKPGGKAQMPQASKKEYGDALKQLANDGSPESFMQALRTQRRLQGR